jgi:hypothetical protein
VRGLYPESIANNKSPTDREHLDLFFERSRGAIAFPEKSCFCPEMAGFSERRLLFRLRADGL